MEPKPQVAGLPAKGESVVGLGYTPPAIPPVCLLLSFS